MMTAKEIDEYIMACPYFEGKTFIGRRLFSDGQTHLGSCRIDWRCAKICPSSKCICAKTFGLERKDDETN